MSDIKLFKDPLYGYIKIPGNDVRKIIDTPIFQRLRRIAQTSYSPLYPSANHNRFEHSIGVYYLGNMAGKILTNEINKNDELKTLTDWENIKNVFLLACLLHDIGHAPFSHTGEKFYLDNGSEKTYKKLHDKLIELVKSEEFKKDVPIEDSKSAAPHEIMSAIIGITNFDTCFATLSEKELFARCITGYKFSNNGLKYRLYNCYISLLNSKVIDVDRLDYLMRDAFFTGFDTVNIDYERLLSHITITDDTHELVYRKGAISIIENFVYAHDSERKWIQSHPVILYDMYIIQHFISKLDKELSTNGKKLFSFESLSEKGQKFKKNNLRISLLCDDDIISLMKMYCSDDDELSKEYFARQNRRSTLWKTEAEYKAFFLDRINGGTVLDDLEKALANTEKYLRKNSDGWIVTDETIKALEKDIDKIETNEEEIVDKVTIEEQKKTKKQVLKVMKCLQNYSISKEEACDFVILEADQFYSGFNEIDFNNINIIFPCKNGTKVEKFNKVVTSLRGRNRPRDNFFYIFYKRSVVEKFVKEEICDQLVKAFLDS